MKKILSLLSCLFIASASYGQGGSSSCIDVAGGVKYIEAPYNSSFYPSTAITIEAWVYPTQFGSTHWMNTIVGTDSWTNGGEQGYVLRCGDGGKVSFTISTIAGWKEAISTSFISLNTWHHVAGTFDGSNIRVYIDGTLAATTAYTGSIKVSTINPLRVGRMGDASQTREFEGRIDEVRLWNTARSQTDLRASMCHRLAGTETGLKLYYPFDEGTGTTTQDKSSQTNNATFYAINPPSWKISDAHVGDTSLFVYPSTWAGISLSLKHAAGDSMTVSTITGSPLGVQLYRTDSPHLDTVPPASHFGLMNLRHWGVFISGTASSFKVDYNFNGYPGIIAPSALTMAQKAVAGPWTAGSTNAPVGTVLSNIATTSRHLILSSKAPQIEFKLLSPTDSATVVLQGNGAQTIDFTWENPGLDASTRYSWKIDKVTGNFSPALMTLPSNNGGKDTMLTFTYSRLDSVLNYISMPQGHTRYYKWTATSNSGLSASEPHYALFTRGTLGLKVWPMIRGIEVYPTMVSNDFVSYTYKGLEGLNGSIKIFDMNGKLIQETLFTANSGETQKINLSKLHSGSYILRFDSGDKTFVQPIEVLNN